MSCSKPCGECAFTKASAAYREPHNALKGVLCLLGGLPFYCHHNIDWWNPDLDGYMPRARDLDICAGWKRETQKLAATGYFKKHRMIKQTYAKIGLGALVTFIHGISKSEKAKAMKALDGVIRALVKERDEAEIVHG